ncbi:MAG: FAD-dependent oxidoreductase [Planctomycetes bacterium]|nr:FAD-dependent oxidoreductase [Planctomycetota bacterium]
MAILVRNIARRLDEPESVIRERVERAIGGPIRGLRIRRASIDARHRRIVHRYDVEVDVEDEAGTLRRCAGRSDVGPCPPGDPPFPPPGRETLRGAIAVVGAGPAGLFAADVLAGRGYRPLVLERGDAIPERVPRVRALWRTGVLDAESNPVFGEGGAGTFSDGKLATRIHRPYVRHVLETLVACGADPRILTQAKPHVGTDRLRLVVMRLRKKIEEAGGEFRFRARVEGLEIREGRVAGIRVAGQRIETGAVVLATGSSADDTYGMLAACGVPLEARPFQMGLRIEHPQAYIDQVRYGASAGRAGLPPADYFLRGGSAHTFCMCPGGEVIGVASEAGGLSTNGMSRSARNGPYANSAIVAPIEAGGDALAGLRFRRAWEEAGFRAGGGGYGCGAQYADDFVADRPSAGTLRTSFQPSVVPADLSQVLPPRVVEAVRRALVAFDREVPGFARKPGILLGPETRASSPVRIVRGPTGESPGVAGLYPVGEGAGYAGGILSSAVDGIGGALAIVRRFAAIRL